jgi:hypothetical protein
MKTSLNEWWALCILDKYGNNSRIGLNISISAKRKTLCFYYIVLGDKLTPNANEGKLKVH